MKINQDKLQSKSAKSAKAKSEKDFDSLLDNRSQSYEVPNSRIGEKLDWAGGPGANKSGFAKMRYAGKMDSLRNTNSGKLNSLASASTNFSGGPLPRKMEPYKPLIQKYANIYNVDPHLIAGVMKQESGGNARARSHCGAMGLMQLMPSTAKHLGVQNPYNPEESIAGGTKYLRQMLDKFGGDTELALAAYNAGPGAVVKYGNQVPPYRETQNYVKAISNHIDGFRRAGDFASRTRRGGSDETPV